MHRLKQHLKWWNYNCFGNVFSNLKILEEKVAQAEKEVLDLPNSHSQANLVERNKEFQLALDIEAAFWKQKKKREVDGGW